jgi:hypothetical protein
LNQKAFASDGSEVFGKPQKIIEAKEEKTRPTALGAG